MGGYDTLTVIAQVDLVHEGTAIPAGTILSVPAGTAVRWLMQKQAKTAPKGSVPTPAPAPPIPGPAAPPVPPATPAKKATPKKPATYQRRDLVPEE